MACFFIFMMQMTMSIATFYYFNQGPSQDANSDPLLITYVVRLMCALALHMMIEPEVYQAIQMIKFTLNRCDDLELAIYQIAVALMQLLGALMTEWVNLLLISSLTSVKDIVMNFVQFAAISQIDDFYANSLKNSFLRQLVKKTSLDYQSIIRPVIKGADVDSRWK